MLVFITLYLNHTTIDAFLSDFPPIGLRSHRRACLQVGLNSERSSVLQGAIPFHNSYNARHGKSVPNEYDHTTHIAIPGIESSYPPERRIHV
jgi:hypothetical protein